MQILKDIASQLIETYRRNNGNPNVGNFNASQGQGAAATIESWNQRLNSAQTQSDLERLILEIIKEL